MAKVKEPSVTYFSKPEFNAKKEKLVERIKKETNPEKIERCLEIQGGDSEYDKASFESLISDVSLKDVSMPGIRLFIQIINWYFCNVGREDAANVT